MAEELEKEIYLDCSNATIQNISAKLAKIYSESLVSRSTNDGGEPMHTSLETSPVLIEEDQEDEEASFDTESNDI